MNTQIYTTWQFNHPDFSTSGPGFQTASHGKIALLSGADSIRQSILLLISTIPGERVMRPTYGCNLQQLAFMPNDETTHGLAIHYVRTALEQWEPRIDILNLDASNNSDYPEVMEISLEYSVRSLQQTEQLMINYHLMGAEN